MTNVRFPPTFAIAGCHNRSDVALQKLPRSSKDLRVSEPRFRMSAPDIGNVPRLRPPLVESRRCRAADREAAFYLSPLGTRLSAIGAEYGMGGF